MYIHPVERAPVKRQLRSTSPAPPSASKSASKSADDKLNPLESLLSNIFNPAAPTTTAKTKPATPSVSLPTLPLSTPTVQPVSSSSTSSLTTSTSSQRITSSTTEEPLFTPPTQSTTVVTQTSTSPSTSGTSDASNNGAPTTGMTPVVTGVVVSASIIFGLIFFALVVRKLFQFRRRNKRVSWAENISPFTPTAQETGYEKALPQVPRPRPVAATPPTSGPGPAPAPVPPPSRMSRMSHMYGPQEAGYGAAGFGGRPAYGVNPDQRDSYYSTRPGYASYQNYPTQQSYPPAAPVPYAYNTTSMGAGVAVAEVGGAAGVAHNNNNAAAPPAALPNPFGVNTVDVAGPVPINVPVAPPAGGQPIMVVTRTFMPNLDDELSIVTGESVRVLAVYDDGWCKVRKLGASEEEGVVPYECLGDPGTGAQGGLGPAENDQSRRASSLFNVPQA